MNRARLFLALLVAGLVCASADSQKAVTRIRVAGGVQAGKLVASPTPVYPPLAKEAGIQGLVRLQVEIARDGKVQNIEVISGHPLLVQAATEAVKQWRYERTQINGEPVEVVTTVDVNFSLAGARQQTGVEPPPNPPPGRSTTESQNPPAGTKPLQVGADVQVAKLVKQVPPEYPPLAREARIQGVVHLKAMLAKDGTVQSLEAVSGHPLLVPAAMDCVKKWRYQPTLVNGEPIEVTTTVDVVFRLR